MNAATGLSTTIECQSPGDHASPKICLASANQELAAEGLKTETSDAWALHAALCNGFGDAIFIDL
jgi:hypothetical protein